MKEESLGAHKDMEIDLREDIAQGSYANLAIISHSATEFVLDFASMLPGLQKPRVSNRVIITPEHAKRLLLSLQDNITRYERQHGEITSPAGHPQQDLVAQIIGNGNLGEA